MEIWYVGMPTNEYNGECSDAVYKTITQSVKPNDDVTRGWTGTT